MSIIRTYFDKNNTILSGSQEMINTGRNPVSEIFYGTNISRFLFFADFGALRDKITDGTINPARIVRHTLKMKNTSNYDVMPYRDYRDQIQFSDKSHSASVDLELLPIYEYWDEGNGYDFEQITNCSDETALVNGSSNWNHRTAQYHWQHPGAIPTGYTPTIATQHFDKGNEDLSMDITTFVNALLTGATYEGFCLKYTPYFEADASDDKKHMAFFTRHTHTFFEPFIETEFDDLVQDDRVNFILNQDNHLVLYVTDHGELFSLDTLPVCTVGASTYPVTQISKGIYAATVNMSGTDYVVYRDIWSNIIINGVTQPDVVLSFTPQPSANRYQIGSGTYEPVRYGVSISGIKRDEFVTQNVRRKVLVNMRKPYTVDEKDIIDGIYYRLYVKQGINQITVIDWTPVNRAYDSNYFIIDTSWLVPQQYFIDIKVVNRGEVNIYNEETRFTVLNQM